MIPAYSPQARGRSERVFATLQGRLPKELIDQGITGPEAANRFLKPALHRRLQPRICGRTGRPGSACVPWLGGRAWADILCIQEDRSVRPDNCVCYRNLILQIPADTHRCSYVKADVRVHQYPEGGLAIFHGPRCLARYDARGKLLKAKLPKVA